MLVGRQTKGLLILGGSSASPNPVRPNLLTRAPVANDDDDDEGWQEELGQDDEEEDDEDCPQARLFVAASSSLPRGSRGWVQAESDDDEGPPCLADDPNESEAKCALWRLTSAPP